MEASEYFFILVYVQDNGEGSLCFHSIADSKEAADRICEANQLSNVRWSILRGRLADGRVLASPQQSASCIDAQKQLDYLSSQIIMEKRAAVSEKDYQGSTISDVGCAKLPQRRASYITSALFYVLHRTTTSDVISIVTTTRQIGRKPLEMSTRVSRKVMDVPLSTKKYTSPLSTKSARSLLI